MRIVDYPRAGKSGFRRFLPSWKLVLGTGSTFFLLGVIAFGVLYATVAVPDPNKNVVANVSVVYWSDGKTELGRFGNVNRRSVSLDQVPDAMQKGVLAAEDRSFYSNIGVSPKGIARAVVVKLKGGSTQGGSTITQQYVKNYFLTQDRTATRKLNEFVIALKVERAESKDTILQNYLNTIYFGRSALGVDSASRAYFGHPAKTMSVSESVLLASIIRSPGLYDPVTHRDRAEQRMQYVLRGMVAEGWITQAEADKVKYPKIAKLSTENAYGGTNGYLLRAVRSEVLNKAKLTDAEIDLGGLRIVSTFDKRSQEAAVQAIADEMPTKKAKGVGVGLVAIKPGDGAVVAMYGGPDAIKTEYNSATMATLQAGSTFKPFTLAAALEDGVSLRSTYDGNSPQTFPGNPKPVNNFDSENLGQIDLVKATAHSVNTVYYALNEQVGADKTVAAAIAAGYPKKTMDLQANPANVLGTSSPHVLDIADAYATFAAQGMHAPAYTVRSVTLSTGEKAYQGRSKPNRAFSKGVMADLTFALRSVVEQGTATYVRRNLDRPAAGKTGTAQDNKAASFAGYTPQLAAAVGMYKQGTKDGRPAQLSLNGLGGAREVTGATFAVKIWTAFMSAALKGQEVQDFPDPVYGGKDMQPTSTATATSTATDVPTTSIPTTTSMTPTQTRTAPPTLTPTATATRTQTPTPTSTATATNTGPVPPTQTITPTSTSTSTPTSTPTQTGGNDPGKTPTRGTKPTSQDGDQ